MQDNVTALLQRGEAGDGRVQLHPTVGRQPIATGKLFPVRSESEDNPIAATTRIYETGSVGVDHNVFEVAVHVLIGPILRKAYSRSWVGGEIVTR